jgi:hypothetical protein
MMPRMPVAGAARRLARLVLVGLALLLFLSSSALAGKKKKKKAEKKYHFELVEVRAGEGVDGTIAADALRLLDAELRKQFAAHPRLVADISGAPEPEANKKKFVKWLMKKKIAGAFQVDVDLTRYTEELEDTTTPNAGKDAKRLVVRLDIHLFGETMPGHKMGMEGEGTATVKEDVGKKMSAKDREFTIQYAIELAVTDAINKALERLSAPPPKKK